MISKQNNNNNNNMNNNNNRTKQIKTQFKGQCRSRHVYDTSVKEVVKDTNDLITFPKEIACYSKFVKFLLSLFFKIIGLR